MAKYSQILDYGTLIKATPFSDVKLPYHCKYSKQHLTPAELNQRFARVEQMLQELQKLASNIQEQQNTLFQNQENQRHSVEQITEQLAEQGQGADERHHRLYSILEILNEDIQSLKENMNTMQNSLEQMETQWDQWESFIKDQESSLQGQIPTLSSDAETEPALAEASELPAQITGVVSQNPKDSQNLEAPAESAQTDPEMEMSLEQPSEPSLRINAYDGWAEEQDKPPLLGLESDHLPDSRIIETGDIEPNTDQTANETEIELHLNSEAVDFIADEHFEEAPQNICDTVEGILADWQNEASSTQESESTIDLPSEEGVPQNIGDSEEFADCHEDSQNIEQDSYPGLTDEELLLLSGIAENKISGELVSETLEVAEGIRQELPENTIEPVEEAEKPLNSFAEHEDLSSQFASLELTDNFENLDTSQDDSFRSSFFSTGQQMLDEEELEIEIMDALRGLQTDVSPPAPYITDASAQSEDSATTFLPAEAKDETIPDESEHTQKHPHEQEGVTSSLEISAETKSLEVLETAPLETQEIQETTNDLEGSPPPEASERAKIPELEETQAESLQISDEAKKIAVSELPETSTLLSKKQDVTDQALQALATPSDEQLSDDISRLLAELTDKTDTEMLPHASTQDEKPVQETSQESKKIQPFSPNLENTDSNAQHMLHLPQRIELPDDPFALPQNTDDGLNTQDLATGFIDLDVENSFAPKTLSPTSSDDKILSPAQQEVLDKIMEENQKAAQIENEGKIFDEIMDALWNLQMHELETDSNLSSKKVAEPKMSLPENETLPIRIELPDDPFALPNEGAANIAQSETVPEVGKIAQDKGVPVLNIDLDAMKSKDQGKQDLLLLHEDEDLQILLDEEL